MLSYRIRVTCPALRKRPKKGFPKKFSNSTQSDGTFNFSNDNARALLFLDDRIRNFVVHKTCRSAHKNSHCPVTTFGYRRRVGRVGLGTRLKTGLRRGRFGKIVVWADTHYGLGDARQNDEITGAARKKIVSSGGVKQRVATYCRRRRRRKWCADGGSGDNSTTRKRVRDARRGGVGRDSKAVACSVGVYASKLLP